MRPYPYQNGNTVKSSIKNDSATRDIELPFEEYIHKKWAVFAAKVRRIP